ncbi:transcription factor ICE1 [Lathyrus oleraceus]|uniref:BHLH domain-containing protein n=1 Tax=Pisum sativum TaxID=3888 RepID=A0A9D4WJP5_PEA|nr:transcription factor ICE1-like [Pisum sativum]KAI5404099.1 hypothetical protein KIW84_051294 [Pisum sativum]
MERDKLPWLQPPTEEERHTTSVINNNGDGFITDDESLSSFRSMLEIEWYMNNMPTHDEQVIPNFQIETKHQHNFVSPSDPNSSVGMQPLGSTSFSPPSNFNFSHLLNTEDNINNIINTPTTNNNNPFGSVLSLETQSSFLTPFQGNQTDLPTQTGHLCKFPETNVVGFIPMGLQEEISFDGGSGPSSSMFLSNDKAFRPVDTPSLVLASPNLLNNKDMSSNISDADKLGSLSIPHFTSTCLNDFDQKTEKEVNGEIDEGLNFQFKEGVGIDGNQGGNDDEDANGVGEVDRKGKKKENPSKSLLAEKRRRKKLGDKMYTLRSIVPIISKMDKASILGDAVEYMNELRQKVNDLQTELELISIEPSLVPTTSTLPIQVNEELCHSNVPSPGNQSTKVEAWEMEDGTVNIRISCIYKPAILVSIMKAFDILGLDIHQATISCFNGFAIDVYKVEQCIQGQKVNSDLIKAVLLNAVDYHIALCE